MRDKVIAIDIDGTICTEERTFDRPLAKPLPGASDFTKKLKSHGWTIILWTARGWEQYSITRRWLDENQIQFDQILMGKPIVNVFVDDRAIKFNGWDEIEEKFTF
jgi:uncharacterized HAD superfamily protein